MPQRVNIDTSIVGIDTDFSGTDACCIRTLSAQEATPNGVGIICDVCGDAWISQIKEDGDVVWYRTFAGKYPPAIKAKIVEAAAHEHTVKRNIILSIVALVVIVIIWNIIDYSDEQFALARILFSSLAVTLIATAASFALFGNLFRRFSRNTKKLKYEIVSDVNE